MKVIAILAVFGAIAATTTVASAATPTRLGAPTVEPAVKTGPTIARATGQSTGDGPADDKECEAWAGLINAVMDLAADDLREGNTVGAANMVAEADRAENDALDRGCMIQH